MSGFNGRRAPNFPYLEDLNTVPPSFDRPAQQQEQEFFNVDVDAELAMFTNTEFFDFDASGSDLPANMPLKFEESEPVQDTTTTTTNGHDVKYLDMLNDFNIPNYSYYPSPVLPVQTHGYPASQPPPSVENTGPHNGQNIIHPAPAPAPAPASVPTHHQASTPITAPQPQASSPDSTTTQTATTGGKRKQDTPCVDDSARMAQEEDKRRRNTAASARFRIKKKEREKNLERTVKEVTSKNATLEARISQLEMENRWLKNLITEKNDSTISDGDLSGMFNKFREASEDQQQPAKEQQPVQS